MALSINPATKTVTIPQADLTLISGTLYELDTNQFRLDLLALLDDEDYIWLDDAIVHNTEVTVAGTTFARTIEFVNGWSVEFEDGQYSVRLAGSNNNIFDVENGILEQNQVQVIAQNSAGLITVIQGSGLDTAQDTRLTEIHRDMGLDAGNPKTITENEQGTSYDETAGAITKEVRKSGTDTTVTRQ